MFKAPFEKRKIGIIETTPNHFHLNDCDIKIANTMAEADQIGSEWVSACNKMDYVIVPNKFYQKVFNKSGVKKPIMVLPHGVDRSRFRFKDRRERYRDTYIFGCCGYLNDRKGVFELLQAFYSEFEPGVKVELHLHTTDPLFGWYKNIADKRIKITSELWDFDKLVDWYHNLDCFVFPSKCEGIGYPPREAMATGLPVILMNYSGLEDIASWGFPLTPAGFSKSNPMREQPGNWAKVDVKELMGNMRFVYENQRLAYYTGKAAAMMIFQEYSWEVCTAKLVEFLNEVSSVSKK